MLTNFLIASLISCFKAQQPLEQLPSVTFCWVLCVIPLAPAVLMLCCRPKKSRWHLEEFGHAKLLPVKLVASLFRSGNERNRQWTDLFPLTLSLRIQAACDVFCVGDDVNIEKANDSLISNDRSWKKSKFRLTYTAEAPFLTEGE